MALLLHAIVPAEAVAVDAPFLIAVEAGPLIGYASSDSVDATEHHRRVTLLHERFSACLPSRFGTRFQDAAELQAVLTQKQEQLCAALARVRGRCELAVTAVWAHPPEVPEGGPGRQYLLRRQQEQRIARELAEAIEQLVKPEAVTVQAALAPRPGIALSMALLVPRASAEAVTRRVASVDANDRVRILVNGPWPPYSFVGLDQREE